jgi:hypothetical protein
VAVAQLAILFAQCTRTHKCSVPLKFIGEDIAKVYHAGMEEGRKSVLLIAASILAARKLAMYEGGTRVPATVSAIADAVRWAEMIMAEIDKRTR